MTFSECQLDKKCMAGALFSGRQAERAQAFAQLAWQNPFEPAREEIEKLLLGADAFERLDGGRRLEALWADLEKLLAAAGPALKTHVPWECGDNGAGGGRWGRAGRQNESDRARVVGVFLCYFLCLVLISSPRFDRAVVGI